MSSPEFDNITRYLRAWSKQLIKNNYYKHSFYLADKTKANRKYITGILEKKAINLLLINGHGAEDMIGGNDNEIIIDKNNVHILKGKMVHTLSCQTAKKLGPLAMSLGAKGYVGYYENFVLISQPSKIARPLDDETAKLFLDPAFTSAKALLNGKTADEAVGAAIIEYKKSIKQALNSNVQSDNYKCVSYLLWNMKNLKSCKKSLVYGRNI